MGQRVSKAELKLETQTEKLSVISSFYDNIRKAVQDTLYIQQDDFYLPPSYIKSLKGNFLRTSQKWGGCFSSQTMLHGRGIWIHHLGVWDQ